MVNPDEAAREDVEEKAGEERDRREGHRLQPAPAGVVPPPACREPSRTEAHPSLVPAHEPVIGDGDAVRVAPEVVQDLVRAAEGRLGFVVSSAERR